LRRRVGVGMLVGPAQAASRRGRERVLGGLVVVVQPVVELPDHRRPEEGVDGARVEEQREADGHAVPERQARAHAPRAQRAHGASSWRTKPTPRTVWTSRDPGSGSTFLRSRAMWTSTTLSMGVARAVSFHTSWASISRETRCPWCRIRYWRSS